MEKQMILLCLTFGASLAAFPQSAPLNYRETVTLLDRMTSDEYIDAVYYHTDINVRRSRTYYDGMGKPVEETCDATGLSDKATATSVEYDGLGRVARKWLRLPTTDNLQHIPSSAVSATAAAFFGDQYAYSQNTYDVLGRLTSTTPDGYYPAGTLSCETTTGEYGKIDNLNIKLNGNQLLSVTDDALPANKYLSFNFVDGANENTEYEYNGVGALTKDLNRGLTIEYDNQNNPQFMQFSDGNTILYDYSPDGTLLRKTYGAHKAEPLNAQSEINGEEESKNAISPAITPAIIYTGATEYSGDIIYKDGKLHKVLFPGGYCTFDHETQEPQLHYFTQDHLGNNRAVVSESGAVEQITHYYPFGGTFGDAGLNSALQQYKYNGKELDRVAGLNTYDYGARLYYPLVPWWDRMDKMCEKYYNVSPYAYCMDNPIRYIDILGNKPGDFFLYYGCCSLRFWHVL